MKKVESLEDYLQFFFYEEKKSLLINYPGLTLHRLRNEIALYALLNNMDSEDLFVSSYIPFRSNPITIFFEKLKQAIPLEYITGYAYFYKSLFKVSSNVLIPRSETEILVELANHEIQKNYQNTVCRVADIGTGSGVIALSLMMEDFSTLDIVASDISKMALDIAKDNFFNHRYIISKKHNIEFLESDRLKEIKGTFDIILSNPPYIKQKADLALVHHQVLTYEPAMALFLDDEKYNFWFEDFFRSIQEKLKPSGISLIEGHEDHLEDLANIALSLGFSNCEIIKDYTGRNRFLKLNK